MSSTTYDILINLENTYTPKYVTEALKRAIINNKKSLAYVEAILKQWKNKTWDEIIQEKDNKKQNKDIKVPSWFNQNWDSKKEVKEEIELEEQKEIELTELEKNMFDIFNED